MGGMTHSETPWTGPGPTGPDALEGAVEGADLAPGSALDWPPCGCRRPVCPDYVPLDSPGAGERDRRSDGGGL